MEGESEKLQEICASLMAWTADTREKLGHFDAELTAGSVYFTNKI